MRRLNILVSFLLMVGLLVALPAFAAEMNHHGSSMMNQSQKSPNQFSKSPLASHSSHAINLSYLMHKEVRNQQGRTIGRVTDVVIGPGGRAEFVVLARSGVFRTHGKYIPIPWKTFMSHTTNMVGLSESGSLVFSLARDKLDKAPGFYKKDLTSSATRDEVCQYFKGECAQNEFNPRSQSRQQAS